MTGQPLSGIRVLDFSWMVAGPYATRILADFGAEVIKVQSAKTARGVESNLAGYFNTWNRNKRSITLDMSCAQARDLVLRLTRISDLVVENFSPRVLSNWGLNYEKLREVNPDLIMLSMSAMGQSGPWKDYVGFAPTLHALSGLTFLTCHEKGSPAGPGFAYADIVAGLYGALAALAALGYRDKTGRGQAIDLSEYEAICTFMGPSLVAAALCGREPVPQGNQSEDASAVPHGCYRCSGEDRWCVIAVSSEEEWQNLCWVLNHPDWTRQERFATAAERKRHATELDQFLTEWTIRHTAEEAAALLQGAGLASGVVQNAENLAQDSQLMARDFFVRLDHPDLGETVSDRFPVRFEEDLTAGWKAAPILGEDNRYVFRELLGLTEEEFSDYVEKGVIG
jgi:crotonobetainyl-CoA:carnitine CoA-transferase CaiB-like acyl-CoA transferase